MYDEADEVREDEKNDIQETRLVDLFERAGDRLYHLLAHAGEKTGERPCLELGP